MGEGDGPAIGNGRDIYGTTLKFVDECLIVIGSHRGPATWALKTDTNSGI